MPQPTRIMTSKNGYVRWGPLITLLAAIVVACFSGSAFLVAQHSSIGAHSEAVHKDQFVECVKRLDDKLDAIRVDLQEIRKELRR